MSRRAPANAQHRVDPSRDLDVICAANLLNTPGAIIFFKDLEGRFIRVSIDCAQLTDRTQDDMVGLTDFDLTDHAHASTLRADEQRIISTGESMTDKAEVDRMVDRAGTWVETSKFPLRDADGAIIGTFGYSRDVTRWELAEQRAETIAQAWADAHAQLMLVEAQLRAVLNGTTDAIAKYDRELRCQYVNPAGERFRDLPLDQLIGRTDRETGMVDSALQVHEAVLYRVLETGEPEDVEFCVPCSQNYAESWFHLSVSPDRDANGAVVGALTSMRDITKIKRVESALARQALHDPLTGLANRRLLMDRLSQALVRMVRHPCHLALFFIDLDYFKDVNDTYGHEVGDEVLVEVARRLEQVARREDTVARLGGDEFVVLYDQVMPDDGDRIADRIVHALATPFGEGAVAFRLSASVGAVVTGDPHVDSSALLRSADFAMYQAKQHGRNRFEVFGV